jgi:hypothetical protein
VNNARSAVLALRSLRPTRRAGFSPTRPATAAPSRSGASKTQRRCFIVRDHNGQALSDVYYGNERGGGRIALARRGVAHGDQHRQAAGASAAW